MITAAPRWTTSRGPKENSSARAKPTTATGSNFNKVTSTAERDDIVAAIGSVFELDTLASAEYFDSLQRKTPIEPEKRLIVAILEDAIQCFQANILAENGKPKKLLDDAEEWLLKEGADWIFSFRNICELLELDAEYLRAGLIRWKQKRLGSLVL